MSEKSKAMSQKPATSATHWAQIGESGALLGMRILLGCFRLGGRPLFKLVLAPVILYYFLANGRARAASMAYIAQLQAAGVELQGNRWRLSLAHFWQFANGLVDKLAVWMGKIGIDQVTIEGDELVRELRAQGRGAVLLIAHLGNFEICRCLSARHPGMRVTVLMHTAHAQKFNRLMQEQASASQVDILQVTEISPATAMMLNERLERGELIAIAGDRVAVNHPENCLMVDFLGKQAPLPAGPFTLAAILKAPLVSIFCVRQERGFRISFNSLSQGLNLARRERKAQLQQLAQSYAQLLEAECRRSPLQWFNFFDFWQQPVAPVTHTDTSSQTPQP